MKIALVIEHMDTARGGREVSTGQIAAGLASRGHEVTILCRRAAWEHPGVAVRPLGTGGLLRVSKLRQFIAAVQREIAGGYFDIVHSTLPVPGANVYQPRGGTIPGQTAASLRRRNVIGRLAAKGLAGANLCRSFLGGLERSVVLQDYVLCLAVSGMIQEEFAAFYGRRHNVRVVYNGADVPDSDSPQRADWRQRRRFELGVRQQDVVFLTVATNFELKGVAQAILAFARWHDNHRPGGMQGRLVVVGRDYVEGYQRIAGVRNVGGEVVFAPATPDIFPWYAAADACVLLSWYDPCSRVVLEATRWGIPSITTVYNGAAEVLASGGGIVVSSPKDTAAVASAMAELADPSLRARRADACRSVADKLSMDRHVEELLAAYEDVLRAGSGAAT